MPLRKNLCLKICPSFDRIFLKLYKFSCLGLTDKLPDEARIVAVLKIVLEDLALQMLLIVYYKCSALAGPLDDIRVCIILL